MDIGPIIKHKGKILSVFSRWIFYKILIFKRVMIIFKYLNEKGKILYILKSLIT